MSYHERQMRRSTAATANADEDESTTKQKDKSDYIAELSDHLDVDTNALKAALSEASEAVVKALVVELGPGDDEVSANARIPDEYPDGTIDGKRRDVVDLATARERVQTLVANSAGTGAASSGDKPLGKMTRAEVEDALDDLGDTLLSEENIQQAAEAAVQAQERGEDPEAAARQALNGDAAPTSNEAGSAGGDASEYPDGTVGADVGRDQPTSNVDEEEADDDLDDYSDGTIGGDL